MLVKDIYGKKSLKGTFGIEIETEVLKATKEYLTLLNPILADEDSHDVFSVPLYGACSGYDLWGGSWKGVYDGSLRNFGVEYIFRKPLTLDETLSAIDEFNTMTSEVPFIHDAPGTSVHVHVNFLNEHIFTALSFMTLWMLFEGFLTEYSGPTRRSNLYAIPALSAKGSVDNYVKVADAIMRGKCPMMVDGHGKYSALNPVSLGTLGTLEARTMRGTTDPEVLKTWVIMLDDMLTFSRGKTPDDILNIYREKRSAIIKDVFHHHEIFYAMGCVDERLSDALHNVYKLASCENWDNQILQDAWGKSSKQRSKKSPTSTQSISSEQFAQILEDFVSEGVSQHNIDDEEEDNELF